MYKYVILAQHVKPGVEFDEPYQKLLKEKVIPYFNSRSLMAKNPKEITSYSFSEDKLTLKILLESQEELPMPSKALRILSTYLVNETMIGEGNYLAGKALFKMSSEEYKEESLNKPADKALDSSNNGMSAANIDCLELVEKVVARTAELLRKGDLETVSKYIEEEK